MSWKKGKLSYKKRRFWAANSIKGRKGQPNIGKGLAATQLKNTPHVFFLLADERRVKSSLHQVIHCKKKAKSLKKIYIKKSLSARKHIDFYSGCLLPSGSRNRQDREGKTNCRLHSLLPNAGHPRKNWGERSNGHILSRREFSFSSIICLFCAPAPIAQ